MGPDLFPMGEPAFDADLFGDRRDARRAHLWIAGALTFAILAGVAGWWWIDRVAAPPALRPTIGPASWIPAPQHRERALAILEQPQGGRP